jgi:hypothetical protein
VFDISNNSTVTIAGLTIANGSDTADEVTNFGGGGILNEAGSTLALTSGVYPSPHGSIEGIPGEKR